jgi:hypothetical protein
MRSITPTRRRRAGWAVALTLGVWAATSSSGMALANVPIKVVSQDPYTNTSSFHKTEVEPDTFSFGNTIVGVHQTGRFIDGGSSNVGYVTSTNGGATWGHGFLPGTTVYANPPGPYDRATDPAVAYDPKHNVWMANILAMDGTTGKAILVNRSTDGGKTFQNPVTVAVSQGTFFDKNWITCDTWAASPFYGNCYVEWDDNALGNLFKMSRSTDGGLTWTPSTVPNVSVIGGQPVVQPNGTVVVPIDNGFEGAVQSFVSTNGGASFTGPFSVSNISAHLVAGNLRVHELPSAEVDGSGKVYVVWNDCRFRSGCAQNDIVMSTSTDGMTWSAVTRIPIDPTNSTVDHFIPGIGVDPATQGNTAHLGVTYYYYPVSNCSSTTCRLTVGYVQSTDGGANWTAPVQVQGPMKLTWLPLTSQGYMVGDYQSTSFLGGKAYPLIIIAKSGTCQLGQITSCREPSVIPFGGLGPAAGTSPMVHDRILYRGPSQTSTSALATAN